MKVLIFSNSDSGLFQFRRELIEALVKNQHEVICSVPDADGFIGRLEKLGCSCIPTVFDRRGTNPIKDISLFRIYRKLIKECRPDVVLTYTIKPNVYGGIACRMSKIPYLANVTGLGTAIENGGVLANISLSLYRMGLKKARCVFFQNEQNESFFSTKRVYTGKSVIIPGSGVNTADHKLESYPAQDNLFHFLFVGRVMRDKGIVELLQAVNQMADEKKTVFLDVVGGCDEDYSALLKEYEQKGIIKYHGQQKDVHQYYKQAHCVVLPSYHEGMSNVLLEAASTGRPVITCNIPGCRETFDEGITGYGCEPKNTDSLKHAMDKMYDTPWSIREKMGLSGREKVVSQFDRQIVIDAYLNQINSIKGR